MDDKKFEQFLNRLFEISDKNIEHYGRLTGTIRELRDKLVVYLKDLASQIDNSHGKIKYLVTESKNAFDQAIKIIAEEHKVEQEKLEQIRSEMKDYFNQLIKNQELILKSNQDIDESLEKEGEGTIHFMVKQIRDQLKAWEKDREEKEKNFSKFYIKLTVIWSGITGGLALAGIFIFKWLSKTGGTP